MVLRDLLLRSKGWTRAKVAKLHLLRRGSCFQNSRFGCQARNSRAMDEKDFGNLGLVRSPEAKILNASICCFGVSLARLPPTRPSARARAVIPSIRRAALFVLLSRIRASMRRNHASVSFSGRPVFFFSSSRTTSSSRVAKSLAS